ncbi:LolA family protein [Jiulongibacter sp. NS-SX5]|uniref:LolA family protein n=1 Tax=Jiulongibacter sp. NS-SX5 TaxID=3463854 RepID=UPI004058DD6C
MRKLAVLLTFMMLSSVAVLAQDAKAGAILDAMSTKYKNMKSFKADFTYAAVSPSGKMGRKRAGKIAVKGVKFKLDMVGQEIYNNGSEIYSFVKETNEVNITEYDSSEDSQFSPANVYTIYKNGYKYSYKGSTTISGKSYDVVQLVPKESGNISQLELVVDKSSKEIKRWTIWDRKNAKTVFDITSFSPNTTLSDSFFSFNTAKYPGVEVVDLR